MLKPHRSADAPRGAEEAVEFGVLVHSPLALHVSGHLRLVRVPRDVRVAERRSALP